jgi:hypothetical protein
VEGLHSDRFHMIGTSDVRGGFFGGPVIGVQDNGLAGIVTGAINAAGLEIPITDVTSGLYESKSVKILSMIVIEAVFQTRLLTNSVTKFTVRFLGDSNIQSQKISSCGAAF